MCIVGIEIVKEGEGGGCYRTTVPAWVLFTDWIVAVARAVEALETTVAGLRPRPAREKGFPSNLFLY